MLFSESGFYEELIQSLSQIDHIKPSDYPNIDLYMDQVTTFMSANLSNTKTNPEDKILTKTMINNYAKDDLLPAPIKKKYSKDHMIVLTFIYYLKNFLPISDIHNILNPLTERFFNQEGACASMDEIYEEIYGIIKNELHLASDDVSQKIKTAELSFSEIDNTEDKDFLQTFSLICMLSYDVFLKKQMISSLVNKITTENNKIKEQENKKDSKKDAKKEQKKDSPKESKKESKKNPKKEPTAQN